jgi:hypothetical protein
MKNGSYFGIGLLALGLAVPLFAEHPTLKASLVDPEKNGVRGTATVTVEVTGVKLVDPALSKETPKEGEAHLHYQLDSGPVIATPTPKLSFHGLPSGSHTLKVILAKNDHTPMGPEQTLSIQISKASEDRE